MQSLSGSKSHSERKNYPIRSVSISLFRLSFVSPKLQCCLTQCLFMLYFLRSRTIPWILSFSNFIDVRYSRKKNDPYLLSLISAFQFHLNAKNVYTLTTNWKTNPFLWQLRDWKFSYVLATWRKNIQQLSKPPWQDYIATVTNIGRARDRFKFLTSGRVI